jgi:hypothetical protein
MDLFDLASVAPEGRGAGENVSSVLAFPVLPFLAFLIASESLAGDATAIGLAVPVGFAALVYVLGRRLGGRPGFLAVCAVICLLASFLATVIGTFFAAF